MPKKSRFNFSELQRAASSLLEERAIRLGEGISKLEKFVHFWVLVGKSFVRNRCPVRASALSYTTLLALIPTLAVALSVTSMFLKTESEEQIEAFIERFVEYTVPDSIRSIEEFDLQLGTNAPFPETAATNPPPLLETNLVAVAAPANVTTNASSPQIRAALDALGKKAAAGYIHRFIQNTYSGTLGATAVVFLVWAAIAMLVRVEETFNDIWGVSRGRDWWSRITNYSTTIVFGPLLLLAALGLATGPHFQKTRALLNVVPFLEPVISQLLPVIVISVTFALFYKLMPNTRVHFSAAFVGGALAGTVWHLFNVTSFYLGSRAVNASKVYGSLALVPLLMLGLYVVWVIVLFGAQVAYAFQNRAAYLQEKMTEAVNQRGREFIALRLMTCIGQRFQRGEKPGTVADIAAQLGIPTRLVHQVMQTLVAAQLVVETAGAELAYTPARPLEIITAHHILLAVRATHGQELVTRDEPVREEVYGEFARIQEAERLAASSVTMLALVNRAQARREIAPPSGAAAIQAVPASPAGPEESGEVKRGPATAYKPEPKTEAAPAAQPAPPRREEPPRPFEPATPEESPFPD